MLLIGDQLVSLSERGILRMDPISSESWKPTLETRIGSGQWRNNPAYWNGTLIAKSESGELKSFRIAE